MSPSMIPSDEEHIIFAGDPEHTGIRLFAIPLLVLSVGLCYLLIRLALAPLIADGSLLPLISCAGSLPLGLGLGHVGESLLKRHWPSGRELHLTPRSVNLQAGGAMTAEIDLSSPIEALCWRFSLADYPRGGRERRFSNRWHCLSCRLCQGQESIVLFAFAPPGRLARFTAAGRFHEIQPKEVYDTSYTGRAVQPMVRPRLSPELLEGPDGPYWRAEQARWVMGLELTVDDFEAVVTRLRRHLPQGEAGPVPIAGETSVV